MVARISAAAEHAEVNVFRRFALMRHWVITIMFDAMNWSDEADDKAAHERLGSTDCVTEGAVSIDQEAVVEAAGVT